MGNRPPATQHDERWPPLDRRLGGSHRLSCPPRAHRAPAAATAVSTAGQLLCHHHRRRAGVAVRSPVTGPPPHAAALLRGATTGLPLLPPVISRKSSAPVAPSTHDASKLAPPSATASHAPSRHANRRCSDGFSADQRLANLGAQ